MGIWAVLIGVLQNLLKNHATYWSAVLMVVAGVSAIVAKNYQLGFTDFLNALTLIMGALTAMSLKHDVEQVPEQVLAAARSLDKHTL